MSVGFGSLSFGMDFAQAIDETIAQGRADAEALMTDRCGVRRPRRDASGQLITETDPVTGVVTPVFDVIYNPDAEPHRGKCKLQTYEGHETDRETGGASQTIQRSSAHVPFGAFRSAPGDVLTILEADDALLVGRSFRITQEYPVKSKATSYRIFVDENVGLEVPPWPTSP